MSEADLLVRIVADFDELQRNLVIHRARLNALADAGRPVVVTHDPACICEACAPGLELVEEAAWWIRLARLILVGVAAGLLIVAVCFLGWRLV